MVFYESLMPAYGICSTNTHDMAGTELQANGADTQFATVSSDKLPASVCDKTPRAIQESYAEPWS